MNNEKLLENPRQRDIHDNRKAWQAPVVEELVVDRTASHPTWIGGDGPYNSGS